VWLEKDGEPVIGRGRAHLLQEIDRTGSIRRAAEEMGLSYRHAWGMVGKMGRASGKPVVISRRGGRDGGVTTLSEHGRELLEAYLMAESSKMAEGFSCPGEEIRCRVVSVDVGGNTVVLRSDSGEGEVTVTIRGSDLAKKASIGDEILLLKG
jgi:molybdate transport repressor ModE-like protein